jgi:hypothetical protein
MFTLSALQARARVVAIQQGCANFAFADAVLVMPSRELLLKVARYSEVDVEVVQAILNNLEYGGAGQRTPDPALQPLIPLGRGKYAISPTLWLHAAPERNLCVLLNRIPEERDLYSRLVEQKEELMRAEIRTVAEKAGHRVIHGKVPGRDDLGDIDVAIVNDVDRECILLELKWFISPAEIREIQTRRKELLKGISQLQLLSEAFKARCPQLLEKVGLPSDLTFSTAVVSKEWIGDSVLQRQDTPVIMQQHLCAKLSTSPHLHEVASWLKEKRYLPRRGRDFEVETATAVVGKWSTDWYGIRALIDHAFSPL